MRAAFCVSSWRAVVFEGVEARGGVLIGGAADGHCDCVHTGFSFTSRLGDGAVGNAIAARRQEKNQPMIHGLRNGAAVETVERVALPCFLIGSTFGPRNFDATFERAAAGRMA